MSGNGSPTGAGDLLLKNTPPKDLEAERAVLGAVLVFPEALDRVRPRLAAADFYSADHAVVFQAAISVSDRGDPVTTETVLRHLQGPEKPEGGAAFDPKRLALVLALESAAMLSLANAPFYVTRIRRAARARAAIGVVASGLRDLSVGDQEGQEGRDERLARLREELHEVSQAHDEQRGPRGLGAVMARTLHEISEAAHGKRNAVPTGFDLLDDMTTGGFQKGEVSLIAGRPGQGKSTLGVNFARIALEQGRGVVFFALEMPAHRVNEILLCSVGRIDSRLLRRADPNHTLYNEAADVAERVETWPLEYVSQDEEGAVSVVMIRDRVRSLRAEGRKVDLVVVDYLQILVSPTQRRERQRREEVEEISRGLKRLAVELDLPIVVMAQFNRQADEGKPRLSNLRESGALEQDAALVLAIYVEEGHEKDTEAGPVKLLVLKNRYGPPGEVDLVWHRAHRRFDEPGAFPPVVERPRTGGDA